MMQGDLLVIGVGGNSRDIAEAVEAINTVQETWNLLGFLDDNAKLVGSNVDGYRVLGTIASIAAFPQAHVVIGVANDRKLFVRREIESRLGIDRKRFATLIHPTAQVSKRARIGCGTVILQFSFVSSQVSIGDHVIINQSVVIAHDSKIGSYVSMAPSLSIMGGVRVGEGVYIGTGARLYPGIEIGSGALVGVGAVVLSSVSPEVTVFGNPARVLPAGKRWNGRFTENRET